MLDDNEFGEVYYALAGKALDLCEIGWKTNKNPPNQPLHQFFQASFGDNKKDLGLPDYTKKDFRKDLANREGNFLNDLQGWFKEARKKPSNPQVSKYAVEPVNGERIALIWNRRKNALGGRDSTDDSLRQLVCVCKRKSYTTVLVGDKVQNPKKIGFDFDRTNFYGDYQLNHIEQIAHLLNLIGNRPAFSIGLQSGGMDGLALFGGIRTIFLSTKKTASNGMSALAKRIPDVFCWCEIQYQKQFEKFDKQVLSAVEDKIF